MLADGGGVEAIHRGAMSSRYSRLILASLIVCLAGGCASAPPSVCNPAQQSMTVAELLFGRKSGGKVIAESAWRDFLAREVTPRFPDGLTVFDASGQWRDPTKGRIAREPSKVVMIAYRDDPTAYPKLEAIAEAYKRRFAQKSVGILTRSVCAAF